MEVLEEDEEGWPTDWLDRVTAGEIAAATVCNIPAFRGCTIELIDEEPAEDAEPAEAIAASGTPWLPAFRILSAGPGCEPCRTDPTLRTAVTAAGGPLEPPAGWFADQQLAGPTPLTIELEPGPHRFRVVMVDGRILEETLDVSTSRDRVAFD
jgi:hypothetical protein